jgi:threonylcarbamoyladenosine tRNA methylthiotransferase MtaB
MPREAEMRVYVSSLGCKLNQSEMDTLAGQLVRARYEVVDSPAAADVCVLNTCAVTHVAAQKSRQALRRLHRENPAARLVVTGCYAELSPEDLRGLPAVELVAGNPAKDRLVELLGGPIPNTGGSAPLSIPRFRTRAFVKIQDGCDNACTYCIIHVARGPQRSRRPEEVLEEVRARLAAGHREIVLTGVHIGAYGRDAHADEAPGLWSLVACILAETGIPRLRLSSIEPWDLPEAAFGLWQDPRLCRHLHLPLQSGCDRTLRRMNRRYTAAEFAALVDAARAIIPYLAVTTDVIVGFPGETEADFEASLAFVRSIGFARTHVFPYSLREGTPAARMSGQVPAPVKAARARAMRAAAAAGSQAFHEQFVGRVMDVLWESPHPGPEGTVWSGLTGNYIRVRTTTARDIGNCLLSTRLVALDKGGVWGEIEDQKSGE